MRGRRWGYPKLEKKCHKKEDGITLSWLDRKQSGRKKDETTNPSVESAYAACCRYVSKAKKQTKNKQKTMGPKD